MWECEDSHAAPKLQRTFKLLGGRDLTEGPRPYRGQPYTFLTLSLHFPYTFPGCHGTMTPGPKALRLFDSERLVFMLLYNASSSLALAGCREGEVAVAAAKRPRSKPYSGFHGHGHGGWDCGGLTATAGPAAGPTN
jgi:hypothetical protein